MEQQLQGDNLMSEKIKQVKPIIIGKNISRLREEKQMTQEEMARQMQLRNIDISRSSYAKIEIGMKHITTAEMEVIKDILETTYEEMMKHTD